MLRKECIDENEYKLDKVDLNLLVDVITKRVEVAKTNGSGKKSYSNDIGMTKVKLHNKFLEQQAHNFKMDADRVPGLIKEILELKEEKERVNCEVEQMRVNYFKDLQVFKIHDHKRR